MTGGDPGLAALVLAAGQGSRLRPLSDLRPKPLCWIGETTLLDLAMRRVEPLVPPGAVAVNAHHLAEQIAAHVAGRAHLSLESPEALGTAGAVGALREWLAGRDVIIANGDVFLDPDVSLAGFVSGWDHTRPRLLVVADAARPDFAGRWRFAGVSLLPGALARRLTATPTGLYEAVWRDADLDLVPTDSAFLDCGDPATYLQANLIRSGGLSVVGAGATVAGTIERCVVWPGAVVHDGERLVEQVRAIDAEGRDVTVPAPQPPAAPR